MKYVLAIILFSANAFAVQYMAVGTGPDGFQSPYSVQKNILDFVFLTRDQDLAVYYGAGNEDIADVAITSKNGQRFEDLTYYILNGSFDNFLLYGMRLEHNSIPNLNGAATKSNVLTKLTGIVSEKSAGQNDQAFRFYFSGHGSTYASNQPDQDDQEKFNRRNHDLNAFSLWGGEEINVKDFTLRLDKIPPQIHVINLMVQCYSGGFGQMNYSGGELDLKKISPANRCGFFSQVESERATGCTPDVYDDVDYSHYFFEAYKKAKNNAMDADFNRDGVVGANEAHAYVLIKSMTVDQPVKTSYLLLRDANLLNTRRNIFRSYKNLTWGEIYQKLTPDEKLVSSFLQTRTGILFQDDDVPYAILSKAYTRARQSIIDAEEDSAELHENFKDYSSEFIREMKSKFPYAFLNPNFASNEREFKQQFEKAKVVIMHDDRFDDIQKKFYDWRGTFSGIDQLGYKRAQIGRLAILVEQKIMEMALLDSEEEVLKEKYQQLQTCESTPYFIN
jgi:hypothetical protein